MPSHVDRFASAAQEFCSWCERGSKEGVDGARTAVRHLSLLYSMALDLRVRSEATPDLDGDASDDGAWMSVFKACAALPFSYYSEVFHPLQVPAEEPVVSDLGDDLADIHRDLMCGLALYRDGHPTEAELEWRQSFESHWGRHASSALRALHCWFSEEGEW